MTWRLFDITAKRADLDPHAIAFEPLRGGAPVSYAALEDRCARAATWLEAKGVSPGDRVAAICRNRVELFELLFACGKLGAILAPLNWRMPAAEMAPVIEDCDPALILHDAEHAAAARGASGGRFLHDFEAYAAERETRARHAGREEWPADEAWYLIYTSGTTGAPKGVINTYGMALANYVNIGAAIGLTREDVTVNFLPLFHTAGVNLYTLPVLMTGGRVLIAPDFEAHEIMEIAGAGRASVMFAVPAVYRALSELPEFETADLSKVRSWGSGGAPLPTPLIERFAERGAQIRHGYGMTESGPTTLIMDEGRVMEKLGSVGKPQLLCRARFVKENGEDAAPGETGEIWLSGPGVTPGYWMRPDETRAVFAPGGWLKTGDLGRVDEEGYVYIAGRIKDMIVSGGENVYPGEIEAVLMRHPAVAEAAVIAGEDRQWGEACHAFIQPRPGAAPDPAEIAAFCRQRLAGYKIPRSITVIGELPRTPAGKILKRNLRIPVEAAG